MKRAARRTTSFIVIVVLVCWAGSFVLQRIEARRWRPLPEGGEVKVYAVTHGIEHDIVLPSPPFRSRASDALSAIGHGSMDDFTSALNPDRGHLGTNNGTQQVVIWLQVRGRTDSPTAQEGTLEVSDSQTFRTGGSASGNSDEFIYTTLEFPFVPFREKTLRFSAEFDGKRLSFEAPNPGYNPNAPHWEALRLPQTQTVGEIALTLRALTLQPTGAEHGLAWNARPDWTITHNGAATKEEFSVSADYLDAGGNVSQQCGLLSEPVWKIRATVTRTEAYPFPDDTVRWMGTIEPEGVTTPAPEKYSLLPIDTETRERGILLAGVFGVGQFEFNESFVTAAGPVLKMPGGSGYGIDLNNQPNSMRVTLTKPGAILIMRFDSGVLLIRGENGAPMGWPEATRIGTPMGLTVVYPLPAKPLRLGTADKAPAKFEFLVHPPEPPKTKEAAAKR